MPTGSRPKRSVIASLIACANCTQVHANRLAAEEELAEKKMMDLMKQEAATEWHAAVLRRRAKKGVVAVRQSATRSRREALRQVVMKHAELHQTRRMQVCAAPHLRLIDLRLIDLRLIDLRLIDRRLIDLRLIDRRLTAD